MGKEISIERISAELDTDRPIWAAVGDLCCRTGDGGDPISNERWELFARIWIEPYRVLMPEWSYVALADRRVVGYLTGCPDTARFARQAFRSLYFAAVAADRFWPLSRRPLRQALRPPGTAVGKQRGAELSQAHQAPAATAIPGTPAYERRRRISPWRRRQALDRTVHSRSAAAADFRRASVLRCGASAVLHSRGIL